MRGNFLCIYIRSRSPSSPFVMLQFSTLPIRHSPSLRGNVVSTYETCHFFSFFNTIYKICDPYLRNFRGNSWNHPNHDQELLYWIIQEMKYNISPKVIFNFLQYNQRAKKCLKKSILKRNKIIVDRTYRVSY